MWCLPIPYLPIITRRSVHNIDIRDPLAHSALRMLSAICLLQFTQRLIYEKNTSLKSLSLTPLQKRLAFAHLKSGMTTNCSQVKTPSENEPTDKTPLNGFLWKPCIASAVHIVSDCHICEEARWVTGDACTWTYREPSWRLHGGGGWEGGSKIFLYELIVVQYLTSHCSSCSSEESAKAKTQKEVIKTLKELKLHLPPEKRHNNKSTTLNTLKYALRCVKQVEGKLVFPHSVSCLYICVAGKLSILCLWHLYFQHSSFINPKMQMLFRLYAQHSI